MESARRYELGVGLQQDSDQIATEVVLLISTIDGSAVGKSL